MAHDKYNSVWVSHSSIGDFLKCPRSYFLRNVFKRPETGRKMAILNGALSLGGAVHNTLENLKNIPVSERIKRNLFDDFENVWKSFEGKKGGFKNDEEESVYKERGRKMIERVVADPGALHRKTIKLKEARNNMPPNFYLSEEENIILCGLLDWIEYKEEDDSVRILDFKTGKNEEDENSLQLDIYFLLMSALQKRKVSGASYWYLESGLIVEKKLPEANEAHEKILKIAREIKSAREKREFACRSGENGCFACRPFEKILKGEAEYIGVVGYGQDGFMI